MKENQKLKAYYIGSKGVAYVMKIKGKFVAMIYYAADQTQNRILNWKLKQSKRLKHKQNAERFILRNLT